MFDLHRFAFIYYFEKVLHKSAFVSYESMVVFKRSLGVSSIDTSVIGGSNHV
jgi:hypothetical protein